MSFDASDYAKQLYEIIHQKPKDDNKLIKLVTSRTKDERLKIRSEYESIYNTDLIKEIQDNYKFNFKEVLVGLFYSPIDYDCYHSLKAVKGLGTDEMALIEILTTRTKEDIKNMISRYKEMYPGRDMIADIKDDTSGNFWNILNSLLEGKRSDNKNPDMEECKKIVEDLLQPATNKQNHVEKYIKVFTEKSKEEIEMIGKIYHKMTQSNILHDIQKNFSGDTKNALVGIIYGMLSPPEYFAKLIYEAIKGLGTNDTTLIRVLITRDEIDMPSIKQYYRHMYNKDMINDIIGDTSGSYQKILVELATN